MKGEIRGQKTGNSPRYSFIYFFSFRFTSNVLTTVRVPCGECSQLKNDRKVRLLLSA